MARPLKKGLGYFPLDIDIFEDDKLLEVQVEYGPLGEVVYLRLLCLIYKNGYYYKFDSMEKLAAVLIKSIGKCWARDKNRVMQVVSLLAESHLFEKKFLADGILTSAGVQRRYLTATERRKRSDTKKDYWLLTKKEENELVSEIFEVDSFKNALKNMVSDDNNGVYVYNNPDNVGDKSTKQTTTNNSKSKQNKLDLNKSNNKLNENEQPTFDSVDIIDNPTEIIAQIYFKCKGLERCLSFTRQDNAEFKQVFPDVDILIEAKKIQSWFDKKKNTNLDGESLQNFIIRWLATAQSQGGSISIKEDEDFEFNNDDFFRKAAEYEIKRS